MPRLASNRLPRYRKHKATGQAVVTLSGKDFYLGKHGTQASRITYERVTAEWLAGGRRLAAGSDGAPVALINDLACDYFEHVQAYYVKDGSPTGHVEKVRQALRRFRRLYGATPTSEFTPLGLTAFRDSLLADRIRKRREDEAGQEQVEEVAPARSTVNGYTAIVKAMFKWGTKNGLVPPSVWYGLQSVEGLQAGRSEAREPGPVRPVAEAVVEATLRQLGRIVGDMVRVQRLTGMRPGEICSMTTGQIDTSGTIWLYRPSSHKTQHHGKERVIAIGPRAQAILRGYLRPELERPLFSPAEADAERRAQRHAQRTTPLSAGNRPGTHRVNKRQRKRHAPGESYSPGAYANAVEAAAERAKVPHWTPNMLRHTRATEVRAAFGLDAAGAVLGHSKLSTTEVYAERSLEVSQRVALATG